MLMLPADEAGILALPILMGLIGRQIILGVIVGLVIWNVWKRLKGEGGLHAVAASAYWFLPSELGVFREFPDASVETWEG